MSRPDYGTVRAPEFPAGLAWLNTQRPLRLAELRGKFVLLDFWTFCCINCMHILPALKRLEHKYPEALVVIGVHSAKFPNEQAAESIRQAILRYRIEHPVVNDRDFTIWQQYAVRAWPTLFLIDPKGYIVGKMSGEGVFEPFDQALQQLIPTFEAEGVLDRTPLATLQVREAEPNRMLAFPGKVTADAAAGRLFLSDTNHHRILVTDFEGRVLHQVGSGAEGLRDGALEAAAFRQPQGTCFDAATETLYVADTENHALRRVDLAAGTVETLAGDGTQAPWGTREAEGPRSPLNSPWDVLLHDGRLYVAMAGPHQLWTFDPATGRGTVYAGNGHENLIDGPRLDAQLAQPSGLASDGHFLYFADSETSALRRVPLGGDARAAVETLIGEGLFEFGDVDGRRPRARLQHPLGLAFAGGVLYVADSYNHKVKRYDPAQRAVTTLLGSGSPGYRDGGPNAATFHEPGGLAVAGDRLFVADTNNHQLRTADLATGHVTTLPVAFPPPDTPPLPAAAHPPQTVAPGAGQLSLHVTLPPGYTANAAHPGWIEVAADDETVAKPEVTHQEAHPPIAFNCVFAPGKTHLQVAGILYLCSESDGRCLMHPVALRVPLAVQAGSPDRLTLDLSVPAP